MHYTLVLLIMGCIYQTNVMRSVQSFFQQSYLNPGEPSLELTCSSTLVQRIVNLEKAFSEEDASDAMHTLVGVRLLAQMTYQKKKNKAPSLDGFSFALFEHNEGIIKGAMMNFMREVPAAGSSEQRFKCYSFGYCTEERWSKG